MTYHNYTTTMRPTDLKFPFEDEPRILLNDRLLYIPKAFNLHVQEEFKFPGWSHSDIFGNHQLICLEYCSGNGAWVAEKAKAFPSMNWIAVEKKFARARKIWSKIKNLQLDNLFVVCGEANNLTKHYIPEHSISEMFINFPDPWPKNRHVKNRLISPSFISEIWRVLKNHQTLTFVTDDAAYSEYFIATIQAHAGFVSKYPLPYFSEELLSYGSSYFDQLWRSQGREIRYHQFQKIL